jgi:hypothetical protein
MAKKQQGLSLLGLIATLFIAVVVVLFALRPRSS